MTNASDKKYIPVHVMLCYYSLMHFFYMYNVKQLNINTCGYRRPPVRVVWHALPSLNIVPLKLFSKNKIHVPTIVVHVKVFHC